MRDTVCVEKMKYKDTGGMQVQTGKAKKCVVRPLDFVLNVQPQEVTAGTLSYPPPTGQPVERVNNAQNRAKRYV